MQGLWVQFLVRELRSSMSSGQKTKQKQYYNKFNKDFKNGPLKKKVLKIKILQSCCWFTSREAMSGRGKGGKGLGKATLSATARFWATTSRASLNLLSAAWLIVVVWSASLGSSTKRPARSWKCFWRTWSGTWAPTPSMPNWELASGKCPACRWLRWTWVLYEPSSRSHGDSPALLTGAKVAFHLFTQKLISAQMRIFNQKSLSSLSLSLLLPILRPSSF